MKSQRSLHRASGAPRRYVRRLGVSPLIVVLSLPLLTGCGEPRLAPEKVRDAEMYEEAIDHLIESSGVELAEGWADPVVFVEVMAPEGLDLEIQVAVVDRFEEDYRIRFVDELTEAVDLELEGLPVREGTLLVALVPIAGNPTDYVVHGEFYLAADHTGAYDYRFVDRQPTGPHRHDVEMTGEPAEAETTLVIDVP